MNQGFINIKQIKKDKSEDEDSQSNAAKESPPEICADESIQTNKSPKKSSINPYKSQVTGVYEQNDLEDSLPVENWVYD